MSSSLAVSQALPYFANLDYWFTMVKSDTSVVIAAFTEEEAERLTGVSRSQLRYWDRTEFFVPSLADPDRRQPFSRLYSFRDLICLQVMNAIRNDAKVSLPHLREVKEQLAHMGDDAWAKTTLYILNKRIVFVNPETDTREEVVSGQGVLQIPLIVVRADMAAKVRDARVRSSDDVGRIDQRKSVAHNRPVVSGTRVPVSSIQAFARAGYSVDEIIREYPSLTETDVKAALVYGEAA